MISNDDEWWLTYWPTIFHQPFRSHWDYSISNAKYDDHPPHPLGLPWTQPRRPKSFAWFCRWLRASCRMAPDFFLFWQHKGSPRGPVNIWIQKTLKILRFTQQAMKHILKPWWIHENEPLKLGDFTCFFPCFLLSFWGLETTSWSSLGWSNIVWTRPGSDIELTIVI